MPKDKPKAASDAADFGGLILVLDAHDLPAGTAQVQVNMKSDEQGRLTTRWGMLQVQFDSLT